MPPPPSSSARAASPSRLAVDERLDAVARALLAKKNPVIEDALRTAKVDGRLQGKIAALLQSLIARGLQISKKAEKHIQAERDEAVVDAWLRGAATCASVEALLRK